MILPGFTVFHSYFTSHSFLVLFIGSVSSPHLLISVPQRSVVDPSLMTSLFWSHYIALNTIYAKNCQVQTSSLNVSIEFPVAHSNSYRCLIHISNSTYSQANSTFHNSSSYVLTIVFFVSVTTLCKFLQMHWEKPGGPPSLLYF